jgi:hypothetical protein
MRERTDIIFKYITGVNNPWKKFGNNNKKDELHVFKQHLKALEDLINAQ